MNSAILSMMAGPIMAALRYAIAAGMTSLATKYAIDGQTTSAIINGAIAAASAGMGVLVSTKPVAVAKVADLPGYSVQTPSGAVLKSAHDAAHK